MPELRLDDARLSATLAELGPALRWPEVADLRPAVRARLAAPRRMSWSDLVRSPRYGLAPVLATIALLAAAVLVASPDARAAATDLLRLRGIEIFRGPAIPTPSPSPGGRSPAPSFDQTTLGERMSLAEAERRAGYRALVPADPLLGPADAVYVRAVPGSVAISLAYGPRAGIPTAAQLELAALVTEIGGHLETAVLGKVVPPGTTLEQLTVNGHPGAWLAGQPHQVFYTTIAGAGFTLDTLRLAGNTLIWEQDGLVLRLEAQVDRATALRIAASFR